MKLAESKPFKDMVFFPRYPVRELADMSEEEIKALEFQYGAPVQRPKKRRKRC